MDEEKPKTFKIKVPLEGTLQEREVEVLYEGLSHSSLGDANNQVILGVGNKLGISILGAVQRADARYGLPHVEDSDFQRGPKFILEQIFDSSGEFCICPLLFATTPEKEQLGDTRGRGKTPPYRPIEYKDFPDSFDRVAAKEVIECITRMLELGQKGITKKKLPEHIRAGVFKFLVQNPEVVSLELHSGWGRANPNPRENKGAVVWSLAAPAFLGSMGFPAGRKTRVHGVFCYDGTSQSGPNSSRAEAIVITSTGIFGDHTNWVEKPDSFIEEIRKRSNVPEAFEVFRDKCRKEPGWSSKDTFP